MFFPGDMHVEKLILDRSMHVEKSINEGQLMRAKKDRVQFIYGHGKFNSDESQTVNACSMRGRTAICKN